ncbi:MAG: type II CAAX endopeptidase family protein [Chloroflexi bacterium]|nr:type II CAAX endopeptidase family protein [Chloroflexota bacterium]
MMNDTRLIALARQAKRLPHVVIALVVGLIVIFGGQIGGCVVAFTVVFPPLFPNGLTAAQDSAALSGLVEALQLIFAFGPVFLLLWLWLIVFEKRPFWTLGFERAGALRKYGRGIIVALLMFGGIAALLAALGYASTEAGPPQLQGPPALAGVIIVLFGWLVQAAAEEVLCRGWLLPVIGARYGLWPGVVISALFFGGLHLLNANLSAIAIVNLCLFGVFIALYALAEGGLWGVCAWHAVWNWAQGNLFGFEVSGTLPAGGTLLNLMETGPDVVTGGAFGPEGGLAVTVMLVVGIIVLLLLDRRSAARH